MKKILTILTMIASLTFTSCEDFLTEEVRGQQNLDTYFQSAEEAEAFITGVTRPLLLADGGISTQYGCFPRCVVMTVGWAIPAKVKVTIFFGPLSRYRTKQWCHLQLLAVSIQRHSTLQYRSGTHFTS